MIQLNKKTQGDLVWSYASYAVLGVAGILVNLLITYFYGPEYLGSFNIVYALYIIFSQVVGLGVWTSALKHVAQHRDDLTKLPTIIASAIAATFIAIAGMGVLLYLSIPWVLALVHSDHVAIGWPLVIPGLLFYSLNKTLLAVENGLRNMRAYSLAQIFRYLGILACFFAFLWLGLSPERLPLILVYPEALLSCLLLLNLVKHLHFPFVEFRFWFNQHIRFGVKCLMSVTVAELNTRVDIIMLGIFMNDLTVGIYSIAAMCVEGVIMLFSPIRDNLNPLFHSYHLAKEGLSLQQLIRKVKWLVYGLMFLIAAAGLLIFPWVVDWFLAAEQARICTLVFYILLAGVFIGSGYMPMNMILGQLGYPWQQSQYRLQLVLSNIVLNLIMIPWLGIYGAALATSLCYALSVVYLKWLAYKHADIII